MNECTYVGVAVDAVDRLPQESAVENGEYAPMPRLPAHYWKIKAQVRKHHRLTVIKEGEEETGEFSILLISVFRLKEQQ